MLDRRQRLRRGAWAGVALMGLTFALAGCSSNNNKQNALHSAGPAAHKILNLFTPFFWLPIAIGVLVVGMTLFVAIRFRDPHQERNPVQTHGNTALEISWTIVPFLILMVMAVPTIATIFNLAKIQI